MKLKLLSGLLAAALVPSVSISAPQVFEGSLKDPGIVNKERIEYWLEKNGDIQKGATEAERKAAVAYYLKGLSHSSVELPAIVQKQFNKVDVKGVKGLSQKNSQNKTVKVLAVLIDFPDLKHDAHGLTSSDTDMYYSSYPVSHYQDLMFSTTGFTGPSGQNFTSGYQYYQNESGGTFSFTGETFGWVTADNNANFYGGNDPDANDNDKNAPALIKEAVTKAIAANAGIDLDEYDIEDPYDLDSDGNVDESDGIIDHVMVYHSSVGEEAGGGNLGDDAIWSHRFYVDTSTNGYTVPGTSKKLFGYTIQPIDAATGVVVHEFGHDLGVPDEYDTGGSAAGSPVGYWSVMAGGSWAGDVAGTKPTGFSPYARSFFQQVYGGNWIDEQVIDFTTMEPGSQSIDLVEAINHNATNQVRIDLPKPDVDFAAPYAGDYQYYSDEGHNMTNTSSFEVDVPASGTTQLSMKARWDIEVDYDYAQVLVNDSAIAGNHTKVNNPYHTGVTNFVTAASADIAGAEGSLGWVDLTFDLSAYANQTISVTIQYVTDPAVGGYGFVWDSLKVTNGSTDIFVDGAEQANTTALDGVLRITDKKPGKPQNYWVQLRSEKGQDSGLAGSVYTPGVVVWFADQAYSNNKVGDTEDGHPGHGFLGVVDADQNPIMRGGKAASSTLQVIDAAFGLYAQKAYSNDTHLDANSIFDDSQDYSLPEQPASGLVLPVNGLSIEVTEQAADNSTATVKISKVTVLNTSFNFETNYKEVTFTHSTSGGDNNYSYAWDFGDGSVVSTEEAPTHTYAQSGDYTVSLTVTDGEASVDVANKVVSIAQALQADINSTVDGASVSVSANVTGGTESYTYNWDFGDGSTAEGVDGEHTYSLTGSYTVTLTVTSGDQQQSEVTKSIDVIAPMNASFTSTKSELKASFTSSASGGDGNYSYAWDFGDGSTSTTASPSHTYSSEGSYTVELVVTDGTGVEKSTSKSVSVTKPASGGGGSTSLWLLLLLASGVVMRRKR